MLGAFRRRVLASLCVVCTLAYAPGVLRPRRVLPMYGGGISATAEACVRHELAVYSLPEVYRGCYGEAATESFKRWWLDSNAAHWRDEAVIVDVGANGGQMLPAPDHLTLARAFAPRNATCLHLIEAVPSTFATLQRAVDAMVPPLPCVSLYNVALAEPGDAAHNATRIFCEYPGRNTQRNRFARNNECDVLRKTVVARRVAVHVRTLDEVLAPWLANPRFAVDHLKSDTEGWDYAVMRGAAAVLRRTRLYLFECHALMRADHRGPNNTLTDVVALLRGFAFDVYIIARRELIDISLLPLVDARLAYEFDRRLQWQNCVALRRTDVLAARMRAELLPAHASVARHNHTRAQC